MKNLFKPGRSAAQTCAQIRKQFHGKRKLKLAFEPDWHLTHGFRRSGGITLVDLWPTQVSNRAGMLASGLKDDYRQICANRWDHKETFCRTAPSGRVGL
jgi:hypothetical protein